MIVSSSLFEAYLECPVKSWLRSRSEPTAKQAYAEWVCEQNDDYHQVGLKHLLAINPEKTIR